MITILCYDLGITYPVMTDLVTMERATDFLDIYNSSKSATSLKKYWIDETYGNSISSEDLINRRKRQKCSIS